MNTKKRASEILLDKYDLILELFEQYDVEEVRIFGSLYKNEDTSESDIDFLVKLPDSCTLIQYGRLKFEVERELSIPTDMLTFSGLNNEVLTHFTENSINLDNFPEFKRKNKDQNIKTEFDKLSVNCRSIVWVIDRIQKSCENVCEEEYISNEVLQDAVSRNIQLLGQIASQIPPSELDGLESIDVLALKGCIILRDALFMNVDHNLLWKTITNELEPLKISVEKLVKS